mmetsp:Transcript_673/g.563  ORF Transcript_673/g.563 Transcript_673/m.563 type:complete len:143 (-) Transcript_673:12-440(-)
MPERPQAKPAIINDINNAGPAYSLAAVPGVTKIPEPTVLAIPNRKTCQKLRTFLRPEPSVLQEYPVNGSNVLVLDLLPPLLCIAVAGLCTMGVRESAWVSSLMTVCNISMILFIIIAGLPFFAPDHFSDFAPRGAAGILGGA